MNFRSIVLLAVLLSATLHSEPSKPPAIAGLVKPNLYKKMIEDRDILTQATLSDDSPPMSKYAFYASMLVKASPNVTRRVLTDYKLYAEMIPYVDRADYSPMTRILRIEGGIWKFRLSSEVQFEERGESWIHYRIIGGHFAGMTGDIYFESAGEKGTTVYFDGSVRGTQWPPKFIIERGAEIVFGFTGKRMRSYIESQKQEQQKKGSDPHGTEKGNEIPQPRRRL